MWNLAGLLGKNAGWKELLSNKNAPDRLKNVIVGMCAHRMQLRHIHRAYDFCSGPFFCFVETKSPFVQVLYQRAELCSLRILEKHAPWMGARREINRQCAKDSNGLPDGAAPKCYRGIFGAPVEAYHGAIETQGRGILHEHKPLWLQAPWSMDVIGHDDHEEDTFASGVDILICCLFQAFRERDPRCCCDDFPDVCLW